MCVYCATFIFSDLRHTLDELEAIVRPMFAPIRNNQAIIPDYSVSPFPPSHTNTRVDVYD